MEEMEDNKPGKKVSNQSTQYIEYRYNNIHMYVCSIRQNLYLDFGAWLLAGLPQGGQKWAKGVFSSISAFGIQKTAYQGGQGACP